MCSAIIFPHSTDQIIVFWCSHCCWEEGGGAPEPAPLCGSCTAHFWSCIFFWFSVPKVCRDCDFNIARWITKKWPSLGSQWIQSCCSGISTPVLKWIYFPYCLKANLYQTSTSFVTVDRLLWEDLRPWSNMNIQSSALLSVLEDNKVKAHSHSNIAR